MCLGAGTRSIELNAVVAAVVGVEARIISTAIVFIISVTGRTVGFALTAIVLVTLSLLSVGSRTNGRTYGCTASHTDNLANMTTMPTTRDASDGGTQNRA